MKKTSNNQENKENAVIVESTKEYEQIFFKKSISQARDGKSITIRKEFHERINRIVNVIGGDKVSLYGYVDNILAQHFENYQDEINELYKKNMNKLF